MVTYTCKTCKTCKTCLQTSLFGCIKTLIWRCIATSISFILLFLFNIPIQKSITIALLDTFSKFIVFFIFDRTYMVITNITRRHKKKIISNSPDKSNQDASDNTIHHIENDLNQNVEVNAAVTATNTSGV